MPDPSRNITSPEVDLSRALPVKGAGVNMFIGGVKPGIRAYNIFISYSGYFTLSASFPDPGHIYAKALHS